MPWPGLHPTGGLAAADLLPHGGTSWVSQDTFLSTPGRVESAPVALPKCSKGDRLKDTLLINSSCKIIYWTFSHSYLFCYQHMTPS